MAETEREKTIKGATVIIKQTIEAAKTAAENRSTATRADPIEIKKAEARRLTQEMKLDPEKAHMRLQVAPKEAIDVTEGKTRMAAAITKAGGAEVSWLINSPTELNYNTQAMATVARIADAPVALRDDPHFLLSEGAKLFWSTDWSSLSSESGTEVRTVLKRIYFKIDEIKGRTPDFTIEDTIVEENLFEKQKTKGVKKGPDKELGTELFEGIDPAGLSPRDRERFIAIREVLNRSGDSESPQEGVTMEVVKSYINQAERMLERAETPNDTIKAAEIVSRLRSRLNDYYNQDRIPSTIMLTRDEVNRIIADPMGFMEWMSQDIAKIAKERGFDSPILEQRMNRYRLITDYFVSDAYNAEKGLQLPANATVEQARRFREIHRNLLDTKGNVLDQYTDRLHALEFSYYIQQTSDFEKDTQFIRLLDRINERGAYGLRAQYGGLAEVALQKMRSIHDTLLRDPELAARDRSLPEIMKEVRARTSQAMLEEQALWKPRLDQYLDRLVGEQKDTIPKPMVIYDEQLCDTVTAVAESSYQMFFEKEQIMTRGLDPGIAARLDKLKKIDAFETADAEEKILATFRFRDWFLRKWSGAKSGQRALWNTRALWYVHKDKPLREWALDKTDSLFRQLQTVSESWQQAADHDGSAVNGLVTKKMKDVREEPLFIKLGTIFSEYEEKHELGKENGKDIKFFAHLKKNKLYRQVACDVGGEVAQLQGARCYGYWESGPRRSVVQEMIAKHPLLNHLFDTSEADAGTETKALTKSLAVGLNLFEEGRGWFFPDRVRTPKAKEAFKKVGERALQLQPHFFYKMECMREEIPPLGGPAAKTLNEVTQRFDTIQSGLMLSGEGSIDYSNDPERWTEGQRRIMRDAFEMSHKNNEGSAFTLSQKQYIDQMKAYYKQLKDTGGFERFTHVKYISDFAFVTFTNDIPVAVLENMHILDVNHIELTRGAEVANSVRSYLDPKVFVQLSHHSTLNGEGKTGLWRRSWIDFATASSTIPLQNDLLESDEKKFAKALEEMRNKVSTYQGPSEGARSALEAIAGYLEAAKVKGGYTEFLKGLKNSSVMKEYWGDLAKSLSLDEVSEEYDKFELLLGKLGKEAPGAEEWVKDYIEVTSWRKFFGGDEGWLSKLVGEERFDKIVEGLNESMPNRLYAYKARNVLLFALVIMMLFAVDQAKKGTEATDKKSH